MLLRWFSKSLAVFGLLLVHLAPFRPLAAQPCDPAISPVNLEAAYTPGVGVQLSWDAVPGSQAAQLKLVSPTGATIKKNLVGFEPAVFFIPDAVLTTGLYSWRVQASCNTTLPLLLTPVSAADLFTVGTGTGLCPTNISDIDGNSYDVAEIDGKCWMRENLQTLSYRNGDPIPAIASAAAWAGLSSGAASAYDNEVSNINTYGVLYNGYGVTDPRGLCPAGWSVPTSPEWLALIDFAGGVDIAGGPLKAVGLLGSGTGLWKAPNSGATNATNFSALPGGYRRPDGSYIGKSEMAIWWTRNTAALGELWGGRVYNNDINVNIDGFSVQNGFSVRCLMD